MAGCTNSPAHGNTSIPWPKEFHSDQIQLLNRVTWGANTNAMHQLKDEGVEHYLDMQLQPDPKAPLPDAVQTQLNAMQISRESLEQLITECELQRKSADSIANDDEKKAAQQSYQQHLNQLAKEAATRSLLRDLY